MALVRSMALPGTWYSFSTYFHGDHYRAIAEWSRTKSCGALVIPSHDQQPKETIDEQTTSTLPCDLLIKSVGYECEPLPMDGNNGSATILPFDRLQRRVPHVQGRVLTAGNTEQVMRGLYVVGWLKRGPTGIIGTNINDAKETTASVIADLDGGLLSNFPEDYDPFPFVPSDNSAQSDKAEASLLI